MKKTTVLCIIDGYAFSSEENGNAIKLANTPTLDNLFANYPTTTLQASGLSVGLPEGQMGNSEVGHTNIGAGRIVYQELTRITKSIQDGDFFENTELVDAIMKAKENDKAVHIMGLLSTGGVHSHFTHCLALHDLCKKLDFNKLYVHAFMDGRDVSPTSGASFIDELLKYQAETGVGSLATVAGRFYALDRDKRWDRVNKAYDTLVYGEGEVHADPVGYINGLYENGVTDEFIEPFIVDETGKVSNGDSVIFFNFRPDRAREITRSLVDVDFDGFARKENDLALNYVCFTQYDATMPNVKIAFKPQSLTNTLGEYIADKGLSQLRISETEKYAHVTFFFNGGVEAPYANEDRVLIDSPKVATYDLQPEMSAVEVNNALLQTITDKHYDLVVLNFANCDMVGHTGDIPAAVKAIETVDGCMKSLIEKVLELDSVLLVTADHGNADKMLDENGGSFTAHTTNPVPFSVVNYDCDLRNDGVLADIAPTILQIMDLEVPAEMTGTTLIK